MSDPAADPPTGSPEPIASTDDAAAVAALLAPSPRGNTTNNVQEMVRQLHHRTARRFSELRQQFDDNVTLMHEQSEAHANQVSAQITTLKQEVAAYQAATSAKLDLLLERLGTAPSSTSADPIIPSPPTVPTTTEAPWSTRSKFFADPIGSSDAAPSGTYAPASVREVRFDAPPHLKRESAEAPLPVSSDFGSAATEVRRPSLSWRIKDMPTTDGSALTLPGWIDQITDIVDASARYGAPQEQYILTSLQRLLTGDALLWYTSQDAEWRRTHLTSWTRAAKVISDGLGIDQTVLRTTANAYTWSPSTSISHYYWTKMRLLKNAYPHSPESDHHADILAGLPDAFRMGMSGYYPQSTHLLRELKAKETTWRRMANTPRPTRTLVPANRPAPGTPSGSASSAASAAAPAPTPSRAAQPARQRPDGWVDDLRTTYKKENFSVNADGSFAYIIPNTHPPRTIRQNGHCRWCREPHMSFQCPQRPDNAVTIAVLQEIEEYEIVDATPTINTINPMTQPDHPTVLADAAKKAATAAAPATEATSSAAAPTEK
ncbi:unnamed protein product [Parajaminaea phylloscopi]